MCSLCGVLGGAGHWTDAALRVEVFAPGADPAARRRQRVQRIASANKVLRHLGLSLGDWQGAAYLLSNRTGKTVIVHDMSQLCTGAETLLGTRIDPLDPVLISRMESSG